jgi:putative heme transporter
VRPRPGEVLARGVLTLLLLAFIAWLLLANVGNLEEVGDALAAVSAAAGVTLVVLLLASQVMNAGQLAATIPGLGIGRGFVAVESAAAASNLIPGPSGTATRLGILRSWGFYTDDFARSWLFTSALTNLVVLVAPALAVVVVAAEYDVSWTLLALAGAGLLVSAIGAVVVWLIMRSEPLAESFGVRVGRFVRWTAGVAHRRPSERDFVEATLRFRSSLGQTWRDRGPLVVLAVVGTYVTTGAIFGISLRATGVDRGVLPLAGIAVAYTLVRLLTIVNFTPGGVGVTEALYVGVLSALTDGAAESQIVAGVLLFRGLTYAGPILLGAVSLLVWRFRRRWRDTPPAEEAGAAAVGAVIGGREPPR